MASRLSLQKTLEGILGSRNVYYQPPASVKMKYPAIVYSRKDIETINANNAKYNSRRCYDVTVIDENPDSIFLDKILELPLSRFDRHYTAENLNHDVFTIYY